MVDPTEMQALAVVSSEIDESKWEVLMSIQCRKAQVYLLKHLNNEAVNLKRECKYMSTNNSALNEEIKHAEFEKQSLQASLATITASRIETKHRYLTVKQDKLDLLKRVETNIVKYQELWLERTKLFDKIPYVQIYHNTNNLTQVLNADINKLENEIDQLQKLIKEKQEKMQNEDRNKIIELAKYMIEERPRALAAIKNSKKAKPTNTDLSHAKEIPKDKVKVDDIKSKFNSDWSFIGSSYKEDTVMMPELQATDDDLDSFSWNLDKLKKQVDSTPPIKTSNPPVYISNPLKEPTYTGLQKPVYNYEPYLDFPTERKSFEQKKLIFILQDINLPSRDAEELVYSANPCEIKEIQSIGGKGADEEVQVGDQEEIEEVDMTPKSQNLVQPPSQYMDSGSLEQVARDEEMEVDKEPSKIPEQPPLAPNKNCRISFDLPTIEEVPERSDSDAPEESLTNVTTNNSQMETSTDDTYNILKEMMYKKHQLDLTPDFTYAKNVPTEKPVVSKFFNDKKESPNANPKQTYPEMDKDDNPEQDDVNIEENEEHDNMEIDGNIDATPKEPDSQRYSGLVRSVLFTHEAGSLPHTLNLSINTTDDGEGDFPQCFDSSLLLSPKADQEPMTNDSTEVTSQDVPNFLTGLRKTGFSLFGMSSAVAQNTGTGANTQSGGFNFNFGGDNAGEKKRGNFFSMFQ